MAEFGVIGSGAFGNALVSVLERASTVAVWEPRDGQGGSGFDEVVSAADAVIVAVPARYFVEVIADLPISSPAVISAAKGLDPVTNRTMSAVLTEHFPALCCGALGGACFASELVEGHPTQAVLGCPERSLVEDLAVAFDKGGMPTLITTDVVGVELGGVVKNVVALAAGMVDGLGLGANTKAMVITRGYAELQQVTVGCGGMAETAAGSAGLGDLVATCTSSLSRNRLAGERLVEESNMEVLEEDIPGVAEGLRATHSLLELCADKDIDVPMCRAIGAVLDGYRTPRAFIDDLVAGGLG